VPTVEKIDRTDFRSGYRSFPILFIDQIYRSANLTPGRSRGVLPAIRAGDDTRGLDSVTRGVVLPWRRLLLGTKSVARVGAASGLAARPPSAFARIAHRAPPAPIWRTFPSDSRSDGDRWDPMRPIARPPVAHRTGVPMGPAHEIQLLERGNRGSSCKALHVKQATCGLKDRAVRSFNGNVARVADQMLHCSPGTPAREHQGIFCLLRFAVATAGTSFGAPAAPNMMYLRDCVCVLV